MAVERRYSARHPIDLPVYIRYRRRPFLSARGRELSVGGMRLDVQALTLPTGTLVELEFGALARQWRVPAIVIHGDQTGIGVMFRDPQPDLFRGLVQAARPDPTPLLHLGLGPCPMPVGFGSPGLSSNDLGR